MKTVHGIFTKFTKELTAVKNKQQANVDTEVKIIESATTRKEVAEKEVNTAEKVIENLSALFEQS
jgi:hypothetical protein